MERHMKKILPLIAFSLAAMAGNVEAHVGQGTHTGFVQGISHPFGGLDHVLAMLAVGLFASFLAGKSRWLLPASFVTTMVVGAAVGGLGFQMPLLETMIALSVVVLAAMVACRWKAPTALAMALVGFFALFHGFSHGAEMPAASSSLAYGLGFVLATMGLHGVGLALADVCKAKSKSLPLGGSAMALAGLALLAGGF
jgi:urease accessory protein